MAEEVPKSTIHTKKARKPAKSKTTDIRAFALTIPHLPAGPASSGQPLRNPLALSLAFHTVHYLDLTDTIQSQTDYYLIHPEESELNPDLNPVFLKISADAPPPIENPETEGSHAEGPAPPPKPREFWYYSAIQDGDAILEQLLELGVLTRVDPPRTFTPSDTHDNSKGYPLVRVSLEEKALARRCTECEIWEQRTDQERLAICSRCKSAWYCDEDCQTKNWKVGEPTPHKKLCAKLVSHNASTS